VSWVLTSALHVLTVLYRINWGNQQVRKVPVEAGGVVFVDDEAGHRFIVI